MLELLGKGSSKETSFLQGLLEACEEAMFCKEMQRLTELAKSYAEDAMVELKCLRREADELRIELRSLSRQPTEDFS